MPTAWFVTLAAMLTAYVVLDGFDFGAGILHLFVAKTDEERRTVLAAIGPFWDGNEVWLVASGGVLVFAFPEVYAVICSGFYLPLTMVLWLLILRGVAIEFRSQESNPLWRSFWDATFALASTAMAAVFGVTLANLVRGFPMGPGQYFAMPLFTDFRTGRQPGALDWYTLLVGAVAVLALAAHGASYLSWKTDGAVHERSQRLGRRLWPATFAALSLATLATLRVDGGLLLRVLARPITYPALFALGLGALAIWRGLGRGHPLQVFLGSSAVIASMIALTAVGLYPTLLRSTIAKEADLSVGNAASGPSGLAIGFWWWAPAMTLAVGYFVFLFRMFRGKASGREYGH